MDGVCPVTVQKDWPGFDVGALFARGGHASLMGGANFMSRPGYGDHCAGVALHSAILGALLLRQQTGKGTVVSTSLLRFSQWMIASGAAASVAAGATLLLLVVVAGAGSAGNVAGAGGGGGGGAAGAAGAAAVANAGNAAASFL